MVQVTSLVSITKEFALQVYNSVEAKYLTIERMSDYLGKPINKVNQLYNIGKILSNG